MTAATPTNTVRFKEAKGTQMTAATGTLTRTVRLNEKATKGTPRFKSGTGCQEPVCFPTRWREICVSIHPRKPGVNALWLENREGMYGCTLCHNVIHHCQEQGQRRTGGRWAKFQVDKIWNQEQLKIHSQQKIHLAAVKYHFCGAEMDVEEAVANESAEDCDCFGAGRPKIRDFLNTHVVVRKDVSGNTCRQLKECELFIGDADIEFDNAGKITKASVSGLDDHRKLTNSMAESVRQEDRAFLMHSTDINLSGDGKQPVESICFHAVDANLAERDGLISLVRHAGETTKKGRHDLDKSAKPKHEKMADAVLAALREFCTEDRWTGKHCKSKGKFKKVLYDKILETISSLAFDFAGDAQKCARLLARDFFPSVSVVLRDTCHHLRVLLREPLLRDAIWAKIKAALWGDRHAPVKKLQYSHPLRSRFIACQEKVLAWDSTKLGTLRKALETVNFCPIRWESESQILEGISCAFLALAILLEFELDPEIGKRPKDEIEAFDKALDQLDCEAVLMIGLSADLVNLAMKYDLMRLFDGKKVSCGPKRRKIREYIEHVTALYLNAGIYSKNNSNTFTAIVINQLSETKVFFGRKTLRIVGWNRNTHDEVPASAARALRRIQAAVALQIELLEMSFAEETSLEAQLDCSDLAQWGALGSGDGPAAIQLRQKYMTLCDFKQWLPYREVFRSLQEEALVLYNAKKATVKEKDEVDFEYKCWTDAYHNFKFQDPHAKRHMQRFLSFVIATSPTSCPNERVLGSANKIQKLTSNGNGASQQYLVDATTWKKYGPKELTDLAIRTVEASRFKRGNNMGESGKSVRLRAKPILIRAARNYEVLHGRRFGLKRKIRKDKGEKHGFKPGSRAWVRARQRLGIIRLTKAFDGRELVDEDKVTCFGNAIDRYQRDRAQMLTFLNAKQVQYLKTNKRVQSAKNKEESRRGTFALKNPYRRTAAERAALDVLGSKSAAAKRKKNREVARERVAISKLFVPDECRRNVVVPADCRTCRSVQGCDAVLVDDFASLLERKTGENLLVRTEEWHLQIHLFGKQVVTQQHFEKAKSATSGGLIKFKSVTTISRAFILTKRFQRNLSSLARAIRASAAMAGSKWELFEEDDEASIDACKKELERKQSKHSIVRIDGKADLHTQMQSLVVGDNLRSSAHKLLSKFPPMDPF